MLETSFGLSFFLKPSTRESNSRYLYLRVTVHGIRRETSTKRKWDLKLWNPKSERAIGTNEDALAEEAGFSTTQRFVSAFKARTGISPSFFTAKLRKEMDKTE